MGETRQAWLGAVAILSTYAKQGFVESVVIFVQVGDNNGGRLVLDHLFALAVVDALVFAVVLMDKQRMSTHESG